MFPSLDTVIGVGSYASYYKVASHCHSNIISQLTRMETMTTKYALHILLVALPICGYTQNMYCYNV